MSFATKFDKDLARYRAAQEALQDLTHRTLSLTL